MTNFEKWKKKLAEAKDSYELMETIKKMKTAFANICLGSECDTSCKECEARWLDMEIKE